MMRHIAKKYQFQDIHYFELGQAIVPYQNAPMSVYCFLVDGLLIDTGQKSMRQALQRLIAPFAVQQIALTHYHEDHAGNANFLAQKYNAPLFASAQTAEKVRTGFRILPYEYLLFRNVEPCPQVQILPNLLTTERHQFLPIHTPGHSPDHYIFLEKEQGWLFAGDFYVGKLRYFRKNEEDIGLHIQSLQKVLQYDFDVLFCAHYPSLSQAKKLLHSKLTYLQDFYDKVATLHQQGKSIKQIRRVLQLKEVRLLKLATFNDVGVDYMIQSVIKNQNLLVKSI